MVAPSDGNGRFDWLKDDMDYIKEKLDELVESHAATCATVRNHGYALRFLFGIMASIIVVLVAVVLGSK